MAFVGGVTIASHIPSFDTAPTRHVPEPRIAAEPARNAVCAARSTMVVDPVRVMENVASGVPPLGLEEEGSETGTLAQSDCTAASTADRLRTAAATSLLRESLSRCSVPLRERPSRGDRMIPKSVTRTASTHMGQSVAVTDTGCIPVARVLPKDASDDEMRRQANVPSPLPVPK